jgi:hypothetical protein
VQKFNVDRMIVYNTTFHIDSAVLEESLSYLKTIYIPKVLAGGVLSRACLRRVMHDDEDEGVNYAVQFHVADTASLMAWMEQEGQALHQDLSRHLGDKVSGFSTLLEEIDWTK